MKIKALTFLLCISLIVSACAFTVPASADEPLPDAERILTTIDAPITAPQPQYPGTYNVNSYYYDRIPELSKELYLFLKDYYDNIPNEAREFRVNFSDLLPENHTKEDEYLLGIHFGIADGALKLDHPIYETKGRLNGWYSNYPGEEGYSPTERFFVLINRSNLHGGEATDLVYARIEQIVETVGEGDRYTKLRKLATYIRDNFFYDPFTGQINSEGFDSLDGRGLMYNAGLYGALVENISVCAGFARTAKVLCDALGIPCIIVGNYSHEWTLVQMDDGKWYNYDPTNFVKLGWDSEPSHSNEEYFSEVFLNNQTFGMNYNDNLYELNVDNIFSITEFPDHSTGHYVYTGEETDFSYVEAPLRYTFGEFELKYTVNSDGLTCTVIDHEGVEKGDLVIPETIDGYTVTAIAPYAFYYCTGFDGTLYIPKTVKSIGNAAFAGCYNLKAIEFSADAPEMTFGEGAFIGCKGITKVAIPQKSRYLPQYLFAYCDSLEEVRFGAHINAMADNVFIKSYNVVMMAPEGTYIHNYAGAFGFGFEAYGEACSFESVDGKWYCEDGSDMHHKICEHGAVVETGVHSEASSCNSQCVDCGAYYCINYGYSMTEPVSEVLMPADCQLPSEIYLECRCGNILPSGKYVGEIDPDYHQHFGDEWYGDADNHYRYCVCGEKTLISEHFVEGDVYVGELIECDICGIPFIPDWGYERETEEHQTTSPVEENTTEKSETEENTTEKVTEPATEDATEDVTEGREEETTKKEKKTTKKKDDTPTSEETTVNDEPDADLSGCGSVIGAGYILAVIIPTLGVTFIRKKRRNK